MPRRKSLNDDPQEDGERSSSRKRSIDAADLEATPTKRLRSSTTTQQAADLESSAALDSETEDAEDQINISVPQPDQDDTPKATTPKRRGRPPRAKAPSQTSTPSKTPAKSIFATPVKNHEAESTTPKRQAADRSARKKSARALIENVVGGRDTEDEDEENDLLVREIYEDSDAEDGGDDQTDNQIGLNGDAPEPETTPSKTGRRRGKAKRAKSPTPPRDLPPHELYFAHNKPGRPKTSDNTLASLALLSHDEYFTILSQHKDRHSDDVKYLENLHAELFPQWVFELSQGFSICLYGFGSKRALLQKFAKHVHHHDGQTTSTRIVIVNGYTPTTTLREILSCIGSAIDPAHKIPTSTSAAMITSIFTQLASTDLTLTVLINSIDASPLRKPGTQSVLSQLASHPQINLVCSTDTSDFPLLWDIGIRSAFNFVFHDCTTFAPFTVELDVVDEVHELLGRKARRVNGREGVAFVLKSLPENAKNLFRLLVGEVLIAMEEDGGILDEAAGVEYRMVYNKAVEEFICSSEMAFRTLLKEYVSDYFVGNVSCFKFKLKLTFISLNSRFHDHQMIMSRKDALGTELLSVPFQKDELETILEDLMS
ncbi:Origin recognition complex subunit 2 [Conoideocrella luteorostrata]|uniref:Origin recognition complex subunit 2 n=1 Tax=Conoideocrella luteorostrata TaxID=1105319 RepID=A0AAJ0CJZ5_9HYPO|nr:Origin recognition complex subunit 2 [Conoideocrella luteorostrata]